MRAQKTKPKDAAGSPVRIVPNARPPAAADLLHQAHLSLAQAERNLFNLLPGAAQLDLPQSARGTASTSPPRGPDAVVRSWRQGHSGLMPCHVIDEGDRYVCRVEMPGIDAQHIDIQCRADSIVVRAAAPASEPRLLLQRERIPPAPSRTVEFPNAIQPDACSAHLQDGILLLTLPKAKGKPPARRR